MSSSKTPKKVLIIGAGIAGMSAGSYLQMNGYDTEILEMNAMAGGLCTAWKRKGYTFDPCTHWLVGAGETSNFHAMWQELGVLRDAVVHNHERFKTLNITGKEFSIYADIDRLEREMTEVGPEDAKVIKEYCDGIRLAKKVTLPIHKARELYTLWDYLIFPFKNFNLIRFISKWRKWRIDEFAQKFKNDNLRELFLNFFTDHEDFSLVPQMLTMAWYSKNEAGRPHGGSLTINGNLRKRYEELGGTIRFSSPVEKILVEDGDATGVLLKNGDVVRADVVISAADMYHTITELLSTGDVKPFHDYFEELTHFPSLINVNLGINGTLPDSVPHTTNLFVEKGFDIGGGKIHHKVVSNVYDYDPLASEEGKTVIMTHIRSHDFHYWLELYENDREAYKSEKQRLADEIIDILDETYSTDDFKLKEYIEVLDISTPVSYKRWTNNFRGSYEGWIPAPNSVGKQMKKTVKGVNNFYFAGHWVEPGGGMPAAALSGRNVSQLICKKDRKKFQTEKV